MDSSSSIHDQVRSNALGRVEFLQILNTFKIIFFRVVWIEFSLFQTLVVCYMQVGTLVALMVSLACFVLLRAFYTMNFELMNTVGDTTIVRTIQIISIVTSFAVNAIETVFMVHFGRCGLR